MSRDDGFTRADIDVGLLDDPKVRRLIRSIKDESLVARCIVAYTAVVLASWDRGERISLEGDHPRRDRGRLGWADRATNELSHRASDADV